MSTSKQPPRRRVLVVGAGAAGGTPHHCSSQTPCIPVGSSKSTRASAPLPCLRPGTACAWSLSRHPDKFEVHVWEALPVPGACVSPCVTPSSWLSYAGRCWCECAQDHAALLLVTVYQWAASPAPTLTYARQMRMVACCVCMSYGLPGGVASSCVLKDGRVLNDQVQGGAPSYRWGGVLGEVGGWS
jgi:hypothetical protein